MYKSNKMEVTPYRMCIYPVNIKNFKIKRPLQQKEY